MNKSAKGNKRLFRSIIEVERAFFPKASKKKALERPTDAKALGTTLAKESLDRIRKHLGR